MKFMLPSPLVYLIEHNYLALNFELKAKPSLSLMSRH